MPKTIRYAGFAPETSFNQETPPAAAWDLDIASSTLDAPNEPHLIYGGGLGRSPRKHRPGYYTPTGNVQFAQDLWTLAAFLRWTLGGYTHTGAEDLHESWGVDDNVLPSFVTRIGKDVFEHVFSGCVINQLQIAVSGEYVETTADIVAARDSKATLRDKDDLALPDDFPLAFHEVTSTIGGTNVSAKVKSLTLTIGNNVRTDSGRGIGSRHAYRLPAGDRAVSVAMGLWFEDTDHLEAFWGGSSGPTDEQTTEDPVEIDLSPVDGDSTAEILMPRCIISQVSQQGSGRDEIEQSLTLTALQDVVELEDESEVETDIYTRVVSDLADLDPA